MMIVVVIIVTVISVGVSVSGCTHGKKCCVDGGPSSSGDRFNW